MNYTAPCVCTVITVSFQTTVEKNPSFSTHFNKTHPVSDGKPPVPSDLSPCVSVRSLWGLTVTGKTAGIHHLMSKLTVSIQKQVLFDRYMLIGRSDLYCYHYFLSLLPTNRFEIRKHSSVVIY